MGTAVSAECVFVYPHDNVTENQAGATKTGTEVDLGSTT